MNVDEVMKLDEEELALKIAEIQGHNNLEWMPQPFDEPGCLLVDKDLGNLF